MLLWSFAAKLKALADSLLEKTDKPWCMVFDDTLLPKTGKAIEMVSRVYDHVTQRYILGVKLLLMGYWDGVSFIPLDFSLHREKGKNKEKPFGLTKNELKKQNTDIQQHRQVSASAHR